MKANTNVNVFYVLPAVLLIAACMCTSSTAGLDPTPTPLYGEPPTRAPTVASEPIASPTTAASEPTAAPTLAAGSFADFQRFAAEIAAALQDKNVSFFDEYAAPSTWTCLGDETFGVCKDLPADTPTEGIPVTYDWERYELPDKEDYQAMWQTTLADHKVVKLVALANQFGDNPFMPMASQSFMAVIGVGDDPASLQEARVLFFEHIENSWHLRGELVTTENAEAWINNTCSMCYDLWAAWPQ